MSTGHVCLTLRMSQGLVFSTRPGYARVKNKKEKKHALLQLLANQGIKLRPSLNLSNPQQLRSARGK